MFHVPDSQSTDIKLTDRRHRNCGLNARFISHALKRVLHRKRIHDRCKHAHIVGACAVKSLRGGCKSAKDVSAADHHAELMPRLLGSADFTGDAVNRFGINSELTGEIGRAPPRPPAPPPPPPPPPPHPSPPP